MTYRAEFNERRGWRVIADHTADGGTVFDICGAINEAVAKATAFELNAKLMTRRAA